MNSNLTLDKIIVASQKLAAGIPLVCIDFYEECGKTYFGEITFYPSPGFGEYVLYVYNLELGKKITI